MKINNINYVQHDLLYNSLYNLFIFKLYKKTQHVLTLEDLLSGILINY